MKKDALPFITSRKLFHCIRTISEVDADALMLEVGNGLSEEEYNRYITRTEYSRLTVK